jgi:hypothetical protein
MPPHFLNSGLSRPRLSVLSLKAICLFRDQHRNAIDYRINPPASFAPQLMFVEMQVSVAGGTGELIENGSQERVPDLCLRQGAGFLRQVRHGED